MKVDKSGQWRFRIWKSENKFFNFQQEINLKYAETLRRPNFIGLYVPVAPDLAKMVKVKSDDSENLAKVLCGAKNGKFSQISPIFLNLPEINFFLFDFFFEKCLLYGAKSPTFPIC